MIRSHGKRAAYLCATPTEWSRELLSETMTSQGSDRGSGA
jgi:hypothetical protein